MYDFYQKFNTYLLNKFIFQGESTDFSVLKIIGFRRVMV